MTRDEFRLAIAYTTAARLLRLAMRELTHAGDKSVGPKLLDLVHECERHEAEASRSLE